MNPGFMVHKAQDVFKECIRAAIRPKRKYRRDWVAVGKYLMTYNNANECRIVRRGHVVNRKNNDRINIYNVITPHRVFVLTTSIKGYDRTGDGRKQEIFIKTVWATEKFTLEQEQRAMEKLKGMISEDQWRQYVVTGQFEEHSERSHVSYFLRRLRPTLAFNRVGSEKTHDRAYAFLAGLCLHPLSYSMDTFAGSQCPTDDIITHLLWIRGDEHRYWSKANQHPMKDVECGIP